MFGEPKKKPNLFLEDVRQEVDDEVVPLVGVGAEENAAFFEVAPCHCLGCNKNTHMNFISYNDVFVYPPHSE